MDALRVVITGDITSFRYPHFVQGVHLTYEMPPPATIYGHICSTIGEFIQPDSLRFAYHFAYAVKFFDYEHLHFFGKEAKMNPFRREQLFQPRLTLYLTVVRDDVISLTELENCFRSPAFAVVLGRSQDLMMYETVSTITLQRTERAFFSGTLLNLEDSARIGGRFYAVTMPYYVNEQRQPQWRQYAVLPDTDRPPTTDDMLWLQGQESTFWVDPDVRHPLDAELKRGVIWHEWI